MTNRELFLNAWEKLHVAEALSAGVIKAENLTLDDLKEIRECASEANASLLELERRLVGVPDPNKK